MYGIQVFRTYHYHNHSYEYLRVTSFKLLSTAVYFALLTVILLLLQGELTNTILKISKGDYSATTIVINLEIGRFLKRTPRVL